MVQRDGVGLVQRDGVGVPLFVPKSGTPTPSLCTKPTPSLCTKPTPSLCTKPTPSPCSTLTNAPSPCQPKSNAIIAHTAELLLGGAIVAIKGLGGYHLACDATNEQAVVTLRERKQRPRKPLAVMYASLEQVRQSFAVSEAEAELLTSPATPIVLLPFVQHGSDIAPSVTSGLTELGVMLPAAPLQHLLMQAVGRPLVMTSGNLSEEPIIGVDDLAQTLLSQVADSFLLHNRAIVSRYDDSVVRVLEQGSIHSCTQFVRRARGYAPMPLELPLVSASTQTVLAVGPEQKSTFCLTSKADAFVSQHLGDLNTANTFDNYLKTLELYQKLFDLKPSAIACDLHPDYLSTQWAKEQAKDKGIPLIQVQHHHAHIAAVLAECITGDGESDSLYPSLCPTQEVIGIALDGTGYGEDGTIWGGEILIASLKGFRRFAHLETFRLPGGAQAIRHPLRLAYALLLQHGLTDHPAALGVKDRLGEENTQLIERMIERNLNSPWTSS
ncbi:MAG: Sua5/YciO/YrdC/YwlC family protein, partial [Coriobacteriia bacterium]|nr:Sua5/YciO/YrdC/YwlC family protein [Coriobacteriia bacterium]